MSAAAIAVMLSYLQPIIIRVFWPDWFVYLKSCVEFTFNSSTESSLKELGPFCLGRWVVMDSELCEFSGTYLPDNLLYIAIHRLRSSSFLSVFCLSSLRYTRWMCSTWTARSFPLAVCWSLWWSTGSGGEDIVLKALLKRSLIDWSFDECPRADSLEWEESILKYHLSCSSDPVVARHTRTLNEPEPRSPYNAFWNAIR